MPYNKIDRLKLKVFPLKERKSYIDIKDVAISPEVPLPAIEPSLAGKINRLAERIKKARSKNASVMLVYGAHLIKNGGGPLVNTLISGTDIEDVKNEAKVFGYAELFDAGIYGSVGDVTKYSKKMVIDKIIKENDLHGSELAVFGDGPVEMQECRKYEGISIGIASDEIRRHGLNLEKRTRLIKAGAHVIVPDFSQFEKLTSLLLENLEN